MHCQVKSYYLFEILFANNNFKAQGQVFFNFTDLICGSAFIAKFCVVKEQQQTSKSPPCSDLNKGWKQTHFLI